jgi:BirA family transcriptional regulator, biotin operon repressor / biotin---[acetyl-CoA-carboxylase] ligase
VRLAALAPEWRVEVLPQTPSTNAVCADRAREGAAEGLVVTTEHQYAGRGRLDRTWEMPPRAAIAVSVLLRPPFGVARWPWLPLMTGVAVAEAVGGRVKWPNDVLLDDRKLCGILVEVVDTPDGPAAVVGIGLNVSLTAEELPVETATSLELARGAAVDRTEVLVELLGRLRTAYGLLRDDPAALAERYVALSATLGRAVRVELPAGGTLEGVATGIEPDGRLVVETATERHAVAAGDVVHARLA